MIEKIKQEEIVQQFINSQDTKESSRQLYKRTIRQYFAWIKESNIDLNKITKREVIAYKIHLENKCLSACSIESYIIAVKKFYKWGESMGICHDIAKDVKSPKKNKNFRKLPLTIDQVKELLNHMKGNIRDYAMINLLLRTGIRTIELISTNIEDITYKQGKMVLMIKGKGEVEKNNFVILTEKSYGPIRKYLTTRKGRKISEPLFVSKSNRNKNKRLSTRSISKIAKEAIKSINVDNRHITAHSLRHTFAVSILKKGGSLYDVQNVLRHANLSTTQIYTKSIEEELRIKNAPEELIEELF